MAQSKIITNLLSGLTTVASIRNKLGLGNTSGALPIENGGTGETSAANARTNLGLKPSSFSVTTKSGGSISNQNNIKMGDMCFCTLRVQTTVAEGTNATCWNIPNGYRPKTAVYTYATAPDVNHLASAVVSTNGDILIGGNHKVNQSYNLIVHYSTV